MKWTMMGLRLAAAAGIGLMVYTLFAPALFGQQSQRRPSLQGHAGLSIPTGRLADLTKPGPTYGLQASYPMTSRTALTLNGDVDELGGGKLGSARAPDMRLWRYGVGLERSLISPSMQRPIPGRGGMARGRPGRWSVLGSVGVGATRFDSQSFTAQGGNTTDFARTYLETSAGVTVKYDWTPRLQLFAGTRGSLSFADKDDTAVLAAVDPRSQARAFGSTVTVPVLAGFTIRI